MQPHTYTRASQKRTLALTLIDLTIPLTLFNKNSNFDSSPFTMSDYEPSSDHEGGGAATVALSQADPHKIHRGAPVRYAAPAPMSTARAMSRPLQIEPPQVLKKLSRSLPNYPRHPPSLLIQILGAFRRRYDAPSPADAVESDDSEVQFRVKRTGPNTGSSRSSHLFAEHTRTFCE